MVFDNHLKFHILLVNLLNVSYFYNTTTQYNITQYNTIQNTIQYSHIPFLFLYIYYAFWTRTTTVNLNIIFLIVLRLLLLWNGRKLELCVSSRNYIRVCILNCCKLQIQIWSVFYNAFWHIVLKTNIWAGILEKQLLIHVIIIKCK